MKSFRKIGESVCKQANEYCFDVSGATVDKMFAVRQSIVILCPIPTRRMLIRRAKQQQNRV